MAPSHLSVREMREDEKPLVLEMLKVSVGMQWGAASGLSHAPSQLRPLEGTSKGLSLRGALPACTPAHWPLTDGGVRAAAPRSQHQCPLSLPRRQLKSCPASRPS